MNRILDHRYELLRQLPTGSGRAVYYGWDHEAERPVFVEELPTALQSADAAAGRYPRVLQSLVALDHPAIVAPFALRRDSSDAIYIVEAYVDSIDLGSICERLGQYRKRLPERLAVHIYAAILDALAHMRKATPGLTHGSLTAGQILVAANGTVRLTGLADQWLRLREHMGGSDVAAAAQIACSALTGWTAAASPEAPTDVATTSAQLRAARVSRRVAELLAEHLSAGMQNPQLQAADALEALKTVADAQNHDRLQAELAAVGQSLLSDEEIELRRKLLALHGTAAAADECEAVATKNILGILTDIPAAQKPGTLQGTKAGVPRTAAPAKGTRTAAIDALLGKDRDTTSTAPRRTPLPRWFVPAVGVTIVVAAVAIVIGWWWSNVDKPLPIASDPDPQLPDATYILSSVPAGALVWVNDAPVGSTPFGYESFPEGPLRLRLEAPGFAPIETVLVVRDEVDVPQFEPFIFTTELTLMSVPPGARPIVNGRRLRDLEALNYTVAATDTVRIAFDLDGNRTPSTAIFNPIHGFLPPTDTTLWRWRPSAGAGPAELIGKFARAVRLRSIPNGALVFIDGDSVPIGRTNTTIDLPYGDHSVLLQKEPYLDYRFKLTVSNETPDLYAPVLKRTVRIEAVDRQQRSIALPAAIRWIKREDQYIRTPEDGLQTPYSLQLDGSEHMFYLAHEDYADTAVTLPPDASVVTVAMRRLAPDEEPWDAGDEPPERWVRFIVKDGRELISGAEVVGVEKETGGSVRFGPTNDEGVVLVPVPIGNYEWIAEKAGYEGKSDGERIKPGRKIKQMTLKVSRP